MIPLNKEPQKRSQLEKVLEVDFPGVSRASYLREKVVQKMFFLFFTLLGLIEYFCYTLCSVLLWVWGYKKCNESSQVQLCSWDFGSANLIKMRHLMSVLTANEWDIPKTVTPPCAYMIKPCHLELQKDLGN